MSTDKKPSRQAQWEAERKAEGWKRVRVFLSPEQIGAIKATGMSMQGFVTEVIEQAIAESPFFAGEKAETEAIGKGGE